MDNPIHTRTARAVIAGGSMDKHGQRLSIGLSKAGLTGGGA